MCPMKLTLSQPGVPDITHEAELVSATGHLLAGDRTYKFKGLFPVDAGPFQYPPPPDPPVGEIEGPIKFRVYIRMPPAASVNLVDGPYAYMCAVEEAGSEGFTLSAWGGGNIAAIQRLNLTS